MSDPQAEIGIEEFCIQHSTFFEETFQMPTLAVAFLKHFLPPETLERLNLEKLVVVKEKFRDGEFRETRPDVVYEVPIIGAKGRVRIHIILEHKSTDDHSAIYQISKYVGQKCVQDVEKRLTNSKTKKPPKNFQLAPVIPIIIHHGYSPFTGKTQLAELFYPLPGVERYLPHQEAMLIDLSAIEDDQLPRDPNAPELHVVLLMMKVIFSKSKTYLKRNFRAILRELEPYSRNRRYRSLIRKCWHYTIYNTRTLVRTDVDEMETEMGKAINEKGDEKMPTLAQKLIKEGKAQGRVEGRAEGRIEGYAEGKAEAILRILTRRFRMVPESLEARIFAITDLECLGKLLDFAFDCESLDEFAAVV